VVVSKYVEHIGERMYRQCAERLAKDFQQNPIDYVAEADIQISLVELLRSDLSPAVASADGIELEGASSSSFKRDYWQTVEQKLVNNEEINRVHAEVSVEQGERLDVAVFKPQLKRPIQWVSGGSKRFSEVDLDCIFELKFVKNKTSFPKQSANPISELADDSPTSCELQRILDFSENKIRADIHELNRLTSVGNRFLLLFSNNNYLYHNPTPTESESYRYGELYHRMGQTAREWMEQKADDGVEILYAHPRGRVWLTE